MSEQRFKSNCSETWKSILEYKENGELEEYSLEDDEQIEELVGVLNEQQTTIQSLKSDKAIAEDYANIFEKENVKLRKQIGEQQATISALNEENEQLRGINKEIGDDLYNCRLNKDIVSEKLKLWQDTLAEYDIYTIKDFKELMKNDN